MVKIPVSLENLDFERLDLHRHFVVIDCDFTVYLILNPVGEKPLSGTDVAVINIGSWQIDAWKFLVRDNFPNEAGFSAVLAWDKTLVQETEQGRKRPRITESDVDIADSVSSLKGQPVNITGFSLDDGKSLKVSTLENEFCYVEPFKGLFPVSYKRYSFKIGGSYVEDRFLASIAKHSGNDVILPCPVNLTQNAATPVSRLSESSWLSYHFNIQLGKPGGYASFVPSGALSEIDSSDFNDDEVTLTLSDGVIDSINVHASGFCSYIPNSTAGSFDDDYSPTFVTLIY